MKLTVQIRNRKGGLEEATGAFYPGDRVIFQDDRGQPIVIVLMPVPSIWTLLVGFFIAASRRIKLRLGLSRALWNKKGEPIDAGRTTARADNKGKHSSRVQ